jgi:hypothetical protein
MERAVQVQQKPLGIAGGRGRRAAPRQKRASVSIALKRLDEIARSDVELIKSIFDEGGSPDAGGSKFSSKIDVEFFEDDKSS